MTLWNIGGALTCSGWRSVFERRAPHALKRLNAAIAPERLGWRTNVKLSDTILSVIDDAYREAASGKITLPVEREPLE
ncbi:MAG: hypothetical protein ACYDCQ_07805 [Dehalococcoidia bacterium]